MRLRKVKDIEQKIKKCDDAIIFSPEEKKGTWHEVFKNDNPIYLEIGMGKGKFIKEHALKNPNINYIGCELIDSVIYKAAIRMREDKPKNLFLINIDASKLTECFTKGEIKKIYLNFSDPWPKTRHEKRRLTSPNFLNIYKNVLEEDGEIEFKTDNQQLFTYSLVTFNNQNLYFLDLNLSLHSQEDDSIITTEYEDKFKKLGQPIYYVKARFKNE